LQVTATLTTWDGAGDFGERVLFIVNSKDGDRAEADAAFDRVCRSCRARPFVIAPLSWLDWVHAASLADDRTLVAQDLCGKFIDLSYFLIGARALRWIESNRINVVVGSSPHELHNYEVKELLEQRVALFIRDGVFVAHTLPSPYIYLFDLRHLLSRMSRRAKTEIYSSTSRAIVGEWYRLWQARARPTVASTRDIDDVVAVIRSRLGDGLLTNAEEAPASLPQFDDFSGVANYVTALHDIVMEREAAHAERAEAVIIRDAIIDRLHQTLENTPIRRLRRSIKNVLLRTNRGD
jgi:hypothetical protein